MRKIFLQHLKRKGLKLTPQRSLILEHFLALGRHVSAEEMYGSLKKQYPDIGQATVFRAMKLLAESGVAQFTVLGGRKVVYEPGHKGHDHLVCVCCGKIQEFRNESLELGQRQIADRYGFALGKRRLEVAGLCPACRKTRDCEAVL